MYEIEFSESALKSFQKLDNSQLLQVAKALESRRQNPHLAGSRLSGNLHGKYKIKLQALGLRVIYAVDDKRIVILVLTIGKRENDDAYRSAS